MKKYIILLLTSVSSLINAQIICADGGNSIVCANGNVMTAGDNESGQLGNNTNTSSNYPVQVSGLTNIIAVGGGNNHRLAIKSDGTVWAWGDNYSGALGDGTNNDSNIPVAVSLLTNVTAISAGGGNFSLALKNDGTVWSWGSNYKGQLGVGTTLNTNIPTKIPWLSGIVKISAGGDHSMALKNDGTVWTWGYNQHGQLGNGLMMPNSIGIGLDSNIPVQVSGISNIISISAGHLMSYALRDDGKVFSWGQNVYGQLGDGTTTRAHTPVLLSLSNVQAIEAGGSHCLFLLDNSNLMSVGQNVNGQLGNGTTTPFSTPNSSPIQVNSISGVTEISAGGGTSIAKKSDGSIWMWGDNSDGRFGNGTTTNSSIPVQITTFCAVQGIDENKNESSIVAYPNPTYDILYMNVKNAKSVIITNVFGNIIYSNLEPQSKISIDISNLPNGVYFIQMENMNAIKFVKQ